MLKAHVREKPIASNDLNLLKEIFFGFSDFL
jgi:hypothetical protein